MLRTAIPEGCLRVSPSAGARLSGVARHRGDAARAARQHHSSFEMGRNRPAHVPKAGKTRWRGYSLRHFEQLPKFTNHVRTVIIKKTRSESSSSNASCRGSGLLSPEGMLRSNARVAVIGALILGLLREP